MLFILKPAVQFVADHTAWLAKYLAGNAELSSAPKGVEYDLKGHEFTNLDLRFGDFSNCKLERTAFVDCNLDGATFYLADFQYGKIYRCSCIETVFMCNLYGAALVLSDCTNATFMCSALWDTDVTQTKFGGARYSAHPRSQVYFFPADTIGQFAGYSPRGKARYTIGELGFVNGFDKPVTDLIKDGVW